MFEELNLPAERRLRHCQPARGVPEIQFLGQRHEADKLIEFEHRPLLATAPFSSIQDLYRSIYPLDKTRPQHPDSLLPRHTLAKEGRKVRDSRTIGRNK